MAASCPFCALSPKGFSAPVLPGGELRHWPGEGGALASPITGFAPEGSDDGGAQRWPATASDDAIARPLGQ